MIKVFLTVRLQVYVPADGFVGSDIVRLWVSDLGNTGLGSNLESSAESTVTIGPVNEAPQIGLIWGTAASLELEEDTFVLVPSGIWDEDIDSDDPLQVQVLVSVGTVSLGRKSDLVFLSGDGEQDGNLTVQVLFYRYSY